MPFTPFHFGPGLALHAAAPGRVSFLAFCAANVLTDTEPLYLRTVRHYPVHRLFHTFPGATLVALATVVIFLLARALARRWALPNHFQWQDLGAGAVAVGALAGTWSHVVLDSLVHADMHPFAPFGNANPFLRALHSVNVEDLCIGAGVLGLIILGIRYLTHTRQERRAG